MYKKMKNVVSKYKMFIDSFCKTQQESSIALKLRSLWKTNSFY